MKIKKYVLVGIFILVLIVIGLGESEILAQQKYSVPILRSETVTKAVIAWDSVGKDYTYRVYRSNKKNGKYQCIAKDISETKYTDCDAKVGGTYYYTVRGTKRHKNGTMNYGKESKPLCINQIKAELTVALKRDSAGYYLEWDEMNSNKSNRYQYCIYESISHKSNFIRLKKGIKTNRYYLPSYSDGRLRYYKVVPYRIVQNKEVYGGYSNYVLGRKVVDVVIFMGQSNMAGRGDNLSLAPVLEPGTAYEYRAITSPGTLHHLQEPFGLRENVPGAINDVNSKNQTIKTGGMVAMLCKTYFEHAGVPIVGVSASVSNKLARAFLPGTPILEDAIRRLEMCKRYLTKNDYETRHIYMVWCQGENDHKTIPGIYVEQVRSIITEMKRHGVEVCFVIQTGDRSNVADYSNIRAAQDLLCRKVPGAIMATRSAKTFVEKGLMSSGPHYSQAGYNLLGLEAGYVMAQYSER